MKQLMNSIFGKERLGYAEALFAGLMRLVPHPANFTPAGGLAVYSGARLSGWRAFATPLVMLVVTGLVLAYAGGYSFWSMTTLFIMASFCVYVLLGRLVRNTENPLAIGGVTFAGSVQFFLVTNFAVWAFAGYYPMTPAGLMTSYIAGLPYFAMTIAGDLFYSAVLFSAHHFLSRNYFPEEAVAAT